MCLADRVIGQAFGQVAIERVQIPGAGSASGNAPSVAGSLATARP
jgi:hypothetical protein